MSGATGSQLHFLLKKDDNH